MICIDLITLSNNFNRNDFINLPTKELVEERFAGDDIRDIKNTINQTEIKNAFLMTRGNVFKFNLKIYAYVYEQSLIFPPSEIEYETIATDKFFFTCSLINQRQSSFTSFSHNRKYNQLCAQLL